MLHTQRKAWRIVLVAAGVLTVVVAYLALSLLGPTAWVFRDEIHQGRQLVDRIEAYRAREGRLPTDAEGDAMLEATRRNPDGCPCYRKTSPDQYILWFQGRSVGASLTFRSDVGAWTEGG